MRRPWLSTLGLLLAPALVCALDLPTLVERARPAVVAIGTFEPLRAPQHELIGTGFVVGDGRHALTNHHVAAVAIDGTDPVALVVMLGRGRNPDVRPARVVASDRFHDLALLAFDGAPGPALPLAADTPVREGQPVALIGYPIGAVLGLYPSTNAGIVSSISPIALPTASAQTLTAEQIRRLREPFEVYQLDVIAYPGNSGSPVFELDGGGVIGVVNSVLARRAKEGLLKDPSAITYAIPIDHAVRLLDAR